MTREEARKMYAQNDRWDFTLLVAMKNNPAEFGPMVMDVIEAEDIDAFKIMMDGCQLENAYKTLPSANGSFFAEVLIQGKEKFFRQIFEFKKWRPGNVDQLQSVYDVLGDALFDLGALKPRAAANLNWARTQVYRRMSHVMAYRPGTHLTIEMGKPKKGALPKIVLYEPGQTAYSFNGIMPKDVKDGKLSAVMMDMAKNLVNSETAGTEYADGDRMEAVNDLETVYQPHLKNADVFYGLRKFFLSKAVQGREGTLLRLFEQRGGTFVLTKDQRSAPNGLSLNKTIVLANINSSTLYHELMHELENPSRVLSKTPIMKQVSDWSAMHIFETSKSPDSFSRIFWLALGTRKESYEATGRDFMPEIIPYMANIPNEHFVSISLSETLVDYAHAYANAVLAENKAEEKRLIDALHNTHVDMTKDGELLRTYLTDVMDNKVGAPEKYKNSEQALAYGLSAKKASDERVALFARVGKSRRQKD